MAPDTHHIDPYLFKCQRKAFTKFVEEKSGLPFVSFASNPYVKEHEGYKSEIYYTGGDALAFQSWERSVLGSGKIAQAVVRAIEMPKNNLVRWQARYGKTARPHQPLYEAEKQQEEMFLGELSDLYLPYPRTQGHACRKPRS